jgi:hypothetical protein
MSQIVEEVVNSMLQEVSVFGTRLDQDREESTCIMRFCHARSHDVAKLLFGS